MLEASSGELTLGTVVLSLRSRTLLSVCFSSLCRRGNSLVSDVSFKWGNFDVADACCGRMLSCCRFLGNFGIVPSGWSFRVYYVCSRKELDGVTCFSFFPFSNGFL